MAYVKLIFRTLLAIIHGKNAPPLDKIMGAPLVTVVGIKLRLEDVRRAYAIRLHCMYSVFTNYVPLAVRFATVAIGMRKAESPEYCRFDSHLH